MLNSVVQKWGAFLGWFPIFFTIVHLLEVDENKNWFQGQYKEEG
jgi:hypothetical protein